jgi:hypothetical protein
MQVGVPSKYQAESERLLKQLNAAAVVLIVVDGMRGNGLSHSVVPSRAGGPTDLVLLLRSMADSIEGAIGPDGVHLVTKEG